MQEPKFVPAAGATLPSISRCMNHEQLHPGTSVLRYLVNIKNVTFSFTLTILTMDHYLDAYNWKNHTQRYFGPPTFIAIQHSLQTPNLVMVESIIKSLTSMASSFAPSRDCLHGYRNGESMPRPSRSSYTPNIHVS